MRADEAELNPLVAEEKEVVPEKVEGAGHGEGEEEPFFPRL